MRLLLVEDNELLNELWCDFLTQEGFDVLQAWSGDQAIQLLSQSAAPDVSIVDLHLPGVSDAIEVADRVRNVDASTPIIFVSGSKDAFREIVRRPIDAFLTKPFTISHLLEIVQRCLATRDRLLGAP